MISITHFESPISESKVFLFDGSIGDYVADNYDMPPMVFKGQPSEENLITYDIDALLAGVDGEYVVIDTPHAGTGLAAQFIISLVIAVVVVALTPKPDLPSNINRQQESPNNKLSGRSNQARPLQRIPDIKGEVLSIPDVIMPTYSKYVNGVEFEHGYYCVGRKQVQVADLKDSDTPYNLITDAGAGIYNPFKMPNNDEPDIQIGAAITEDIIIPFRSNEVDGIVLEAPDQTFVISGVQTFFDDVLAVDEGIVQAPIRILSGIDEDSISNLILTTVLVDLLPTGTFDISGTYPVILLSKTATTATFQIDTTSNPWPSIANQKGNRGTVATDGNAEFRFTDWFFMTREEFDSSFVNIVSPNGMYKDSGVSKTQATVEYLIQFEGVDSDGVPNGIVQEVTGEVTGASTTLTGTTSTFVFDYPQRFRCRAGRVTELDIIFSGTVVDEIKFTDLYGVQDVTADNFGNVTTIQTLTKATPLATSIKERQLNCTATELVNTYVGGGAFSPSLIANKRAVQSFITDALDPLIGNLTLEEIAADDLLALETEIDDYFGVNTLSQFNYTFDSTDITFQEYTQTVFNAINCIAFREQGKVSALFERPQDTPAMLFTHRSKRPRSETHTRNFNFQSLNDGVEFNYVDPDSNTTETIYLPENRSALNPKKFDIAGIRNRNAALIRANREFNKIKFKKIDLSVTVTAEGRFVKPNDLISVVKGTRVLTYDGEILAQDGLELTLSADVAFIPLDTHSITLKKSDGSVENIIVTAGSSADKVILDSPPSETVRTGIDSRRTEFSFGNDARKESERWLVQEVDISDKWFVDVKAINYTDEYYSFDLTSLRAFSDGFSDGFS